MRRRLAVAIVGVAGAAVILFALPLALVLRSAYRDQELLRLQRDTVAAARMIDVSGSRGDPIELPRSGDRVAVYDGTGHRAAGRTTDGPPRADDAVRAALRGRRPATRTPSGALVVAVPLLAGERVSGAIRAQRSDAVVARRAHRAWLALVGAAAFVVALAGLAAALLGRRLARPLERVAIAARRLGGGDFSVRVERGGVAEVDAVAEALDATAARLDDLITRERAFSSDASHQLRTPLAALRLDLESIQLSGPSDEAIDAALAQVDRLQQTIDTLLAVARGTPRATQTADLAAVMAELEDRWRGSLARDGRRLVINGIAGGPATTARVSPAILGEILDVLLDNAHRHGAGPVTVTVRGVNGWRAIDVADAGPGIPDPEGIFERREHTGDGHNIGLALARSLAHAEGGRLELTTAAPHPVFSVVFAAAE